MTDPTNNTPSPQGNSFKNIADLLKIDGSESFDLTETEKEVEQLEYRRKQADEFRRKLNEFRNLTNVDDYMASVLKELVEKGMTMLDSLQREIEDDPRGRDVETAASMISAIGMVVEHIHKIKFNNARINIEQEKLNLKKNIGTKTSVDQPASTGPTNIIMVGTTDELLDRFIKLNNDAKAKTITIEPAKDEKCP